jgi:hypothetical protein
MGSKNTPNPFVILLGIVLIAITVFLFSSWGYQWVNYVLSRLFAVETESNLFDLFIGLIAMASSVVIFIGTIYMFQMNKRCTSYIKIGAVGFFIKNTLDISQRVYSLSILPEVSTFDVQIASLRIGLELLQLGFWIFVFSYVNRKEFSSQLA